MEATIAAGIEPTSPPAGQVVADLVERYARTFAAADTGEYRARLLTRLEIASDPRAERCWPTTPPLAPIFDWFIQALRHHPCLPRR
ncbi:MAG TPA: hypothetical protein VFR67_16080 [Pilimelia sp.]|nr:hypothetical protein [Pilimelia sp.]